MLRNFINRGIYKKKKKKKKTEVRRSYLNRNGGSAKVLKVSWLIL